MMKSREAFWSFLILAIVFARPVWAFSPVPDKVLERSENAVRVIVHAFLKDGTQRESDTGSGFLLSPNQVLTVSHLLPDWVYVGSLKGGKYQAKTNMNVVILVSKLMKDSPPMTVRAKVLAYDLPQDLLLLETEKPLSFKTGFEWAKDADRDDEVYSAGFFGGLGMPLVVNLGRVAGTFGFANPKLSEALGSSNPTIAVRGGAESGLSGSMAFSKDGQGIGLITSVSTHGFLTFVTPWFIINEFLNPEKEKNDAVSDNGEKKN